MIKFFKTIITRWKMSDDEFELNRQIYRRARRIVYNALRAYLMLINPYLSDREIDKKVKAELKTISKEEMKALAAKAILQYGQYKETALW